MWRILGWVAPLLALLVVLSVLRGAGVPLTVPGVLITLVLLLVVRFVVVRARRGTGRR